MLLRILLLALLPASAAADAGSQVPDCEEEAPLSRAAADLLVREAPPSSRELRNALRRAGSDLVGVRALFVRQDELQARRWLKAFRRAADADVVCGMARSERGQLLLVGSRAGELAPLDGERPLVRGRVAATFRDPQLMVEDAAGALTRLAIAREQLARGVALSDALVRPIKVQLLASGPAGPRPLAERILPALVNDEANDHAPVQPALRGAATTGTGTAERLDALRAGHGRPALRANRLLAEVATAHAQDVCAEGRVAHELAAGSDPQQRLRRAGVQARRVGETVARAVSEGAAFAAFLESPSHRFALLERDFTDVGIGRARDRTGRRCVVVLLATWPRVIGR